LFFCRRKACDELDEKARPSKKQRAADRPLSSLSCKCKQKCLHSITSAEFSSQVDRYAGQNESECQNFVINTILTSSSLKPNLSTRQYYIKGSSVCRKAFQIYYLITDHKIKTALKSIKYATPPPCSVSFLSRISFGFSGEEQMDRPCLQRLVVIDCRLNTTFAWLG
jgi:hypothetical protein